MTKFQIGDLIIRNDSGHGPLLFKQMPNVEGVFTDHRRLMANSTFLILENEFKAKKCYSDFGDTSAVTLVKVFCLDQNEIVYLESWTLWNWFVKVEE